MNFGGEGYTNLYSGLDGGAKKGNKHIFFYEECSEVEGGNRGKTFSQEAHVGCRFMEEQDQVVEVA